MGTARPRAKNGYDAPPRRLAALGALAVALLLMAPGAGGQGLPETGFTAGEPFPTVAFPSLTDGQPTAISDFRGKRVILHVFASW